jgi:hypothetical protein
MQSEMQRELTVKEAVDLFIEVLAIRGYLVVGTVPGFPVYPIGHIIKTQWQFHTGQPFKVIAYATREEYMAQHRLFEKLLPGPKYAQRPDRIPSPEQSGTFYRIATD